MIQIKEKAHPTCPQRRPKNRPKKPVLQEKDIFQAQIPVPIRTNSHNNHEDRPSYSGVRYESSRNRAEEASSAEGSNSNSRIKFMNSILDLQLRPRVEDLVTAKPVLEEEEEVEEPVPERTLKPVSKFIFHNSEEEDDDDDDSRENNVRTITWLKDIVTKNRYR